MSTSFAPSVIGTMSDLDGLSIPSDFHNYNTSYQTHQYQPEGDDFGFDPPRKEAHPQKMEQTYSPSEDENAFDDFDFDPAKDERSPHTIELDRLVGQNIPSGNATISRFGQVTPPRSNSESSTDKPAEQQKPTRQRRATKSSTKEELTQAILNPRKRRNTRKDSTVTNGNSEEDDKRKQSLEKNRLAAAKCRVNKKEKTEQLQRDSHDKAVQNAFLKDQVMRMKEEVQQMNALLLAHANCEGCRSPDDIQKHLSHLGNEFFAHHMQGMTHDFPGFANISYDGQDIDHDHYFSPNTDTMMNPPLPDFDREPEFDVSTPMQTD